MNCSQPPLLSNTTTPLGRPSLHMSNCTLPSSGNQTNDAPGRPTSARFSLQNIALTLWYVMPPLLLLLGTFGNVMIVVVMRGMRSSTSTACLCVYFTALAISDQCLLVLSMVWYGVDTVFSWPPSFFYFDLLCTVPRFVFYTCSLTSAWFLVAMTYQRVTSVVAPHRVVVLCTVRRGKMVTSGVVLLSTAINLYSFFILTYQDEYTECVYLEKYADLIDLFMMLDLFWASVIPFVLLIVGNSVLIWHVIKSILFSQHMREKTTTQKDVSGNSNVYPMTMTLILTSAAFLILTLPICIFHAYSRSLDHSIIDEHFRAVLNLVETVTLFLWSSASAFNFYLYLLSGKKFRQEAKRYFVLA